MVCFFSICPAGLPAGRTNIICGTRLMTHRAQYPHEAHCAHICREAPWHISNDCILRRHHKLRHPQQQQQQQAPRVPCPWLACLEPWCRTAQVVASPLFRLRRTMLGLWKFSEVGAPHGELHRSEQLSLTSPQKPCSGTR